MSTIDYRGLPICADLVAALRSELSFNSCLLVYARVAVFAAEADEATSRKQVRQLGCVLAAETAHGVARAANNLRILAQIAKGVAARISKHLEELDDAGAFDGATAEEIRAVERAMWETYRLLGELSFVTGSETGAGVSVQAPGA